MNIQLSDANQIVGVTLTLKKMPKEFYLFQQYLVHKQYMKVTGLAMQTITTVQSTMKKRRYYPDTAGSIFHQVRVTLQHSAAIITNK